MRRALASALCVIGSWALAETPLPLTADCQTLLQDIPHIFQSLTLVNCGPTNSTQIRAQAVFTIQAADVIDWATLLGTEFEMGPMRTKCCGYEAQHPGTLPIPAGSDMERISQAGTLPFLDVTLYANGIYFEGTINTQSSPLALGDADGILTITWGEV